MMHSESHGALRNLMDQTERLNDSIVKKFDQFRKKGIKVHQFSSKDKALTKQALAEFELSADEDQVDMEGIQIGDGNYRIISHFSVNVRKLYKMIKARQIINALRSRHRSRREKHSLKKAAKLAKVAKIEASARPDLSQG